MKVIPKFMGSALGAGAAAALLTACGGPASGLAQSQAGVLPATRVNAQMCMRGWVNPPEASTIIGGRVTFTFYTYRELGMSCTPVRTRARWTTAQSNYGTSANPGHVTCERSCKTTKFWTMRPGTYTVWANGVGKASVTVSLPPASR
jgi:hypothetical protein